MDKKPENELTVLDVDDEAFIARFLEIKGNLSNRKFADELSCSEGSIRSVERGTSPSMNFLRRLAIRKNVSLDWLILNVGKRDLIKK